MKDVMQHPTALVGSKNIGAGTRIWAFVNICPGAVIGTECNICDHVFIENDVVIGNRVTLKCGVFVWDRVTLEDDVFIGPGVAFTNDLYPRSKDHSREYVPTLVRRGASIGANATILAGITIGKNAMVGAGSVVTRDVPPNVIVRGNPARVQGFVKTGVDDHVTPEPPRDFSVRNLSRVPSVRLIHMPNILGVRGTYSCTEIGDHLPFNPQRFFLIHGVSSQDACHQNAHQKLEKLLVCVNGSCRVCVDDGENREEVILDSPDLALHIPAMVWSMQYKYTSDAVLLVLASEKHQDSDEIRDYDEFINRLPVSH